MFRSVLSRFGLVALLLAVSGCACCNKRCCIVGGGDAGLQAVHLPQTGRGQVTVDASAVADPQGLHTSLSAHDDAAQAYCLLEPHTAQCLAARASRAGRLLVNERRAVLSRAASSKDGITPAVQLQADILALASVHARNESAEQGLELYYRTAQAEATLDALREQQAEAEQLLSDLLRIEAQGLPRAAGRDAAESNRLALAQAQPSALGARAKCHDQLAELLGVADDPPCWFWPDTPLRVEVAAYDPAEEIAIAWAHRADLALLRRVERSLRGDTVDGVRGALQQVNPLLGSVAASVAHPCCCLAQLCGKNHGDDCEAMARQAQAAALVADRQEEIAGEVRRAIISVEAALHVVAWAQASADQAAQRLEEIEALQAAGRATAGDAVAARVKRVQARQQLIDAVIDWEVARVKLRSAQGLLADECGYTLGDPLGNAAGCVELAASQATAEEDVVAVATPPAESSFVWADASSASGAAAAESLEAADPQAPLLPLEEHLP